jgi:hypothetical protein
MRKMKLKIKFEHTFLNIFPGNFSVTLVVTGFNWLGEIVR